MKLFDKDNFPSLLLSSPNAVRLLWAELVVSLDKAITALTIMADGHESEIKALKKKNKRLEDRLDSIEQQLKLLR